MAFINLLQHAGVYLRCIGMRLERKYFNELDYIQVNGGSSS